MGPFQASPRSTARVEYQAYQNIHDLYPHQMMQLQIFLHMSRSTQGVQKRERGGGRGTHGYCQGRIKSHSTLVCMEQMYSEFCNRSWNKSYANL